MINQEGGKVLACQLVPRALMLVDLLHKIMLFMCRPMQKDYRRFLANKFWWDLEFSRMSSVGIFIFCNDVRFYLRDWGLISCYLVNEGFY